VKFIGNNTARRRHDGWRWATSCCWRCYPVNLPGTVTCSQQTRRSVGRNWRNFRRQQVVHQAGKVQLNTKPSSNSYHNGMFMRPSHSPVPVRNNTRKASCRWQTPRDACETMLV